MSVLKVDNLFAHTQNTLMRPLMHPNALVLCVYQGFKIKVLFSG